MSLRRLYRSFATTSSEALKRTALYNYHVNKLKAKMVPFAGYEMPVNYPEGVLQEHLHCRNNASLFDVSHMGQVKITGKDALEFVESIVVGNIAGLKSNHSTLSLILNSHGGIIDDTIVTRFDDHIHMVVNASNKNNDLQHMNGYKSLKFARKDVNIIPFESNSLVALQGPKSAEVLQQVFGLDTSNFYFMTHHEVNLQKLGTKVLISRSGYTGEDGFEISVPSDKIDAFCDLLLANSSVKPAGLGARDSLRLEAGLCLHGNDIDEERNPVEAALMWTVRKTPGLAPFIGYEEVQRATKEGVKQKRVGFLVDETGIVRGGASIMNEQGQTIGTVTSGTFSPILKKGIGMAYVNTEVSKIGTSLVAFQKGRPLKVKVSKMPFVPAKYYRAPEAKK
eukprot:TRINITY_DN4554_c0_g3_i2.p1 TRINITY_DN4554_c0_g3~~TRINITY_DN4554_c0_g3_i2.p1  ORF type:complete len:394 (-),score=104.58 TRINITY_DN4554_c0_g3_i2:171-1352(-)